MKNLKNYACSSFFSSFAGVETASEAISNSYSCSTSLWSLILAENLPSLLIELPGILIYFLSTFIPALAKASAKLILFTEPKSLSPAPTFAAILTEVFFNCSTIVWAAAINFASSSFLASNVAERTALFLGVAKTA